MKLIPIQPRGEGAGGYPQSSIMPRGPIMPQPRKPQSLINVPAPNRIKMMTKLIMPTINQLTFRNLSFLFKHCSSKSLAMSCPAHHHELIAAFMLGAIARSITSSQDPHTHHTMLREACNAWREGNCREALSVKLEMELSGMLANQLARTRVNSGAASGRIRNSSIFIHLPCRATRMCQPCGAPHPLQHPV